MGRASSKERILKAAEAIVARDGAGHLTLDAVAAEAGISKGGLLYHFRTKRHLIAGILQAHCEALHEAHRKEKEKLGENLKTELEAYLQAMLNSESNPMGNREIGVALIAAIANEPEIVKDVANQFDDMEDRLWGTHSTFNPDAAILWLANQGLKFFELLDHEPFLSGQREALIQRMIELSRDPSPFREKSKPRKKK